MTEPLSPRAANSRKKILEAATALLVDSGPRSVTVDAVAEASGVAKSTLYRHWPSRDHLLIDVVRIAMPTLRPSATVDGFESALRSLLLAVADSFSVPEWARIFSAVSTLRTTMPELDSMIEADIADKRAVLAEVLDIGIGEGLLPSDIDVNNEANLLIGPLAFAAITAAPPGAPAGQLRELANSVTDSYLVRCTVT